MKTGRKYGEKEKMQILIKSLIFRTLQIYIFSFYAFLFFVSLAEIEISSLFHENVCFAFQKVFVSGERIVIPKERSYL